MNRISRLVLIVGLLSAGTASAQDLVGRGRWQSTNAGGVKGSWAAKLTRTEAGVRGTLSIVGSNVFAGGDVEGTISGGQLILGVFQEAAKVASFAGKMDAGKVSGEWEAPVVSDSGVWEGCLSDKCEEDFR